jgi:hypothetical protein
LVIALWQYLGRLEQSASEHAELEITRVQLAAVKRQQDREHGWRSPWSQTHIDGSPATAAPSPSYNSSGRLGSFVLLLFQLGVSADRLIEANVALKLVQHI